MTLCIPAAVEQSDEALVRATSRGARQAFAVLFERYRNRIYRLAVRMSRNASDAEEIAQETFLQAYRGMPSFKGESRFSTWLYRIAVNEALLRRRSTKRRPLELVDPLLAHVPGQLEGARQADRADDLVCAKTTALRVRDALDRLDESQRVVLVLRDLEELSAEQAAEILGISCEAVRQRAHRARLKLRELLGDILAEAVPCDVRIATSTPPRRA
jgi:RNA polymerase sigma-70 factor, ECF subfamily